MVHNSTVMNHSCFRLRYKCETRAATTINNNHKQGDNTLKVAFFSNYLNHHQLDLCLEINKLTGGKFIFVATSPVPVKRLALGYEDMNKSYSFVKTTYDGQLSKVEANQIALTSDIVIIGSASDEYIRQRLRKNRLTFRYMERIFKAGIPTHSILKRFIKHARYLLTYDRTPLYILCASAFTAFDFSLSNEFLGKTYKWGYFPRFNKYDDLDNLMAKKENLKSISLLWVGRLIDWKHPEIPVLIAARLKREGYLFSFDIIGEGELHEHIKELIQQQDVEDCVRLLGAVPARKVRDFMEHARIFLFTSDRREGWGCVLNEAMNSGCAVLASHAIGSVPFLIEHKKNGLIYEDGNIDDLYSKVKILMDNKSLSEQYGKNAYKTINEEWNATIAAERLLAISSDLLSSSKTTIYKTGPGSRAPIIRDNWFNENE